MASDQIEERPGFSDLLADLNDSDVVIEIMASAAARRPPEAESVQPLQDAIEASYRALAGSVQVQLETVAVVEEVVKRSLSLWLRVQTRGSIGSDGLGDTDQSLLKFLARGTLAIIAWMVSHDPVRFLSVVVVATPCPLGEACNNTLPFSRLAKLLPVPVPRRFATRVA